MRHSSIRQQFDARLRPRLSHWKQRMRLNMPRYRCALQNLAKTVSATTAYGACNDISGKASLVRRFVNEYSVHQIDAEHDQYAFNVPRVIQLLHEHLNGQFHPPHLSCGPRAYVMKELLGVLGMQSRIIDIFEIAETEPLHVNPHTLIEVFDEASGEWHMQDPDFNVQYVHAETREPVSASWALQQPPELIAVETQGGEVENPINLTNTINELFSTAILYRHSYSGQVSSVLYSSNKENPIQESGVAQSFRLFLAKRDKTLFLAWSKKQDTKKRGVHLLCL